MSLQNDLPVNHRKKRSKDLKERLYESASNACTLDGLQIKLDNPIKVVFGVQSLVCISVCQVPQFVDAHAQDGYIGNYFTEFGFPHTYIPDCQDDSFGNDVAVDANISKKEEPCLMFESGSKSRPSPAPLLPPPNLTVRAPLWGNYFCELLPPKGFK